MINCTALVTNCFILCRLSKAIFLILPNIILERMTSRLDRAVGGCEIDGLKVIGADGVEYVISPLLRYLVMIILEHVLIGVLLVVSDWMSGIPDLIQKKIATSEVISYSC